MSRRRRRLLGGGLGVRSGLQLWLDAEDKSTLLDTSGDPITGSGNVATWVDKSGSSNNATQGTDINRPESGTSTQNGKNVTDWDGSDDMEWPAGLLDVFNEDNTVFVVSKRLVDAGTQGLFGSDANKAVLFYGNAGEVNYRSNNASSNTVTVSGVTTTNFNILRGRREGTTQALAINGGAETTNVGGSDITGVTDGFIGATDGGANNLTGSIAEILIYNRSLSASEIAVVENYLAAKWGITS